MNLSKLKPKHLILTTLPIAALAAIAASTTLTGSEFRDALEIDRSAPDRSGPLGGFAPVVEKVAPSVVSIYTEKKLKAPRMQMPRGLFDDPFFRRFFGDNFQFDTFPDRDDRNSPDLSPQPEHRQRGLGSGVVLTPDGYIITNNHVIDGADEIKVRFPDRNKDFEAEVIGRDPSTDVAVLRVKARNLQAATLGDSSKLKIGDTVIAIGNPFGLSETVTSGIVSGLGRKNLNITSYENFIQTDASINPGNSGGALIDNRGRVIGINTAIVPQRGGGGNIGIGFAIPINMALDVAERLIEHGEIKRGFLGVTLSDLGDDLAEAFGTRAEGALVNEVMDGTPAHRGGMQAGDILIKFDGKRVEDMAHARLLVADTEPGSSVEVVVLRDGKEKPLTIKIGNLDDSSSVASAADTSAGEFLEGVRITTLDDSHRRTLGYDDDLRGALVTDVDLDSPAADAGLTRGAVIVEVDRKPVENAHEAIKALKQANDRQVVLLRVITKQGSRFIAVKIPNDG